MAAKEEDDTAKLNDVINRWDELDQDEQSFNMEYMTNHTSTVVTPYLAFRTSYALELDELKSIVAGLDSSLNKTLNLITITLLTTILTLITYNVVVNGIINYISFNGI